jgi:hypothetical protein
MHIAWTQQLWRHGLVALSGWYGVSQEMRGCETLRGNRLHGACAPMAVHGDVAICDHTCSKGLSLEFSEFSFVFASRLCNRVAHEITRQASSMLEMVEWHDDPSSSIQGLLEADCNPIQ